MESWRVAWQTCALVSSTSGGIFDAGAKTERLAELDHLSSDPAFWDDPNQAQELLRERTQIKDTLETLQSIGTNIDDCEVMLEFASEDADALAEASASAKTADSIMASMEFQRMLGLIITHHFNQFSFNF